MNIVRYREAASTRPRIGLADGDEVAELTGVLRNTVIRGRLP